MSTETTTHPAPMQGQIADRPRCSRCGSTDLGRGYILGDRPKFRPAHFATKGLPPARVRRLLRVERFTLEIACAVCRSCGHLILEIDPEKLKAIEKQYPA